MLLPLTGWGMGPRDGHVRATARPNRRRRSSTIVWKICVYPAMQNHRSIYDPGMNNCVPLYTQTHTMNTISFLFRNNSLPPPPFISYNAKYKPLSLFPFILDPFFFSSRCHPDPPSTIPSFSPLCPIMDFSCDVRRKYLLLECIDCFNSWEQRAKERGEIGDWRHRRVRTKSISLIRRASVMHRQIYTHIHVQAHTHISGFLCPLI